MTNQVVLIGRIVKDPFLVETENSKVTNITIAVNRSFKNMDGEYETDFITCQLWRAIAESTVEYCKKGDLIGIKGRLQTSSYEKDGKTIYTMDVIAEKVTFLSSKKAE